MTKEKEKSPQVAEARAARGAAAKGSQGQTVRLSADPTGPRGRLCQLLRIPADADNAQVFEDALRMIEELNGDIVKLGAKPKGS